MKWLVSTLVGLFLALAPLHVALAAGEFQADYDVQYAISPQGKTIVTQKVTLTNKLSNFYPKKFSLVLDSDKISNVIAYDEGGVITPDLSVKDGKTIIGLTFNTKAIGLGKANTFSLRYEHAGIASQNGNVWEVYIPGVVNDADIGKYDVSLSTPPTFGPVAYMSPPPGTNNKWTKEQMINGGIAAAFGAQQNFDVNLSYKLTNPGITPRLMDIAIPPDTAYQKVYITKITPKPNFAVMDDDGNWLFRYNLLPAQSIDIVVDAKISVYLEPRKSYTQSAVTKELYLGSQPYWDTTDPAITTIAKDHHTPQAIYQYVANKLTYDYTRVTKDPARLGAKSVLSTPTQAVCTEFTDLFIAIARAAGIPARRNVGYAYTNNPKLRPLSLVSDVLHAWPEYYDESKKMWIPVDPTWANTTGGVDYFTKLDFNHIVFAINGKDSTFPYPAGFYHDPHIQKQDVHVEFSESEPSTTIQPKITTQIEYPVKVLSGKSTDGTIVVTNTGPISAYAIPVSATSTIGGVQLINTIPILLPYGTLRIPFHSSFPASWKPEKGMVTAEVNGEAQSIEFEVAPPFTLVVIALVGVLCVLFILGRFVFLWIRPKPH